MCNCQNLPRALSDPAYWAPRFPFKGQGLFPAWFQELDTDGLTPELSFGVHNYRCGNCGQAWYIECAPEEHLSPLFCLKVNDATSQLSPNAPVVTAAKQFVAVLAHAGFSDAGCAQAGCRNFALNGRALCHLHLAIP